MGAGGGIEHQNGSFKPLDRAVSQIVFRDVASAQVNEQRLAGMMLAAMLHDIMHIFPGQITLSETLGSVPRK